MEPQGSFYKVLGVTRAASEKDLRDAYKSAAIRAHPDKGGSDHEFSVLQKAYETLRDGDKRREYDNALLLKRQAKYFRRPPPLLQVKSPTTFALPDGEVYIFETAPDKLRCKFRHGDIVSCAGETGCFIGLGAYETLYWVKQGQQHATALFSLGMGDDRVNIVLRAVAHATPQRKTSFASTTSRASASQDVRRGSTATDERVRKLREEIMHDERLRRADQRTVRLLHDERDRRIEMESLFREMLADIKTKFVSGIRRLRLVNPRAEVDPPRSRVASRSPVRDYIFGRTTAAADRTSGQNHSRPQTSPARPPQRAQTPVAPARRNSSSAGGAAKTPLRSVTPLGRASIVSSAAVRPASSKATNYTNVDAATPGGVRRGSFQVRVPPQDSSAVRRSSIRVASLSPVRKSIPQGNVADPVPVIRFRRRDEADFGAKH